MTDTPTPLSEGNEVQSPVTAGESEPTRLKYEDRQQVLADLEEKRPGRLAVSLFNLDRQSIPNMEGLSTHFDASVKEPLFRVLSESYKNKDYEGIDLVLYTRGGDTNAVWPIVNLLREFDPEFQVLAPFRCHSSGTLVALGAKSIVMGPLSELSPIDPTCGNQFNPREEGNPNSPPIGISVEDVQSYRDFLVKQLCLEAPEAGQTDKRPDNWREVLSPHIAKLTESVHPLALGNVHRVIRQIEKLAKQLLELHPSAEESVDRIIQDLTTHFFSHTHMLDRHEAKRILGDRVVEADTDLADLLNRVLGCYKKSFRTWDPFFWIEKIGDEPMKSFEFVGGVVETRHWSYLYRTTVRATQTSGVPQGVNVQLPPNQPMPLIPGLPRQRGAEKVAQGWKRNSRPTGVSL